MNETEPVAILPTESVGTAIITRFNALKLGIFVTLYSAAVGKRRRISRPSRGDSGRALPAEAGRVASGRGTGRHPVGASGGGSPARPRGCRPSPR